jgi:uncharacterized protein (DUF488 family)
MPERIPLTVYTIGHSTRAVDALIDMLGAHGVRRLADVRTVPRSRHNPQFDRERLPGPLAAAGISYVHVPGLGGLRHPRKDSINAGWRNAGFRGYADYMQTEEFARHLGVLIEEARAERLAIMCAEAVPWRCHRSLISDALTVRGIRVLHVMTRERADSHELTSFARVDGVRITYPEERSAQPELPLGELPAH